MGKIRCSAALSGLCLLTAALIINAPTNAATLVASNAGVLAVTYGGGQATFDSVTPSTGGFTDGGATFTGNGVLESTTTGNYAEPYHDNSQYLAVLGGAPAVGTGSSEAVTFSGIFNTLGLYWGSMDTYNSIAFYNNTGLIDTVTGSQAAAAVPPPGTTATGAQTSDLNNRFITISDIGGQNLDFTYVIIESSTNSFELDNLAWGDVRGANATPLPAALPLFATGLGVLGLFSRRRKRNAVSPVAAV